MTRAGLLGLVAVAVVAWWLTPDGSGPGGGAALGQLAGVAAVVVLAWSVVTLAVATRRGRLDRRWWTVLALLGVVAAGCGVFWRVATATVIGANIGAGLLIVLGGPVALVLLVAAALVARSILTRPGRDRLESG